MSRWVIVSNGIVSCVGVAVPVLRIGRVWYNRVRLGTVVNDKGRTPPLRYGDATQRPGMVEHEAEGDAAQVRGFVVHVGVLSRIGNAR
jgi:hypothetical protein